MNKGNKNIAKYGEATRFKKGEAPGKPKGALHFASRLRKQVAEEMNFPDVITKKKQKGQLMDAMISRLTHMALSGDIRALQLIMDKVDNSLIGANSIYGDESEEERRERLNRLTQEEQEQLIRLISKMYD